MIRSKSKFRNLLLTRSQAVFYFQRKWAIASALDVQWMSLYDEELFIWPDGKPMVFCLLAERESPEYGQYRQALVREVEWRGVVVLGRLGQDCNYSRTIRLGKEESYNSRSSARGTNPWMSCLATTVPRHHGLQDTGLPPTQSGESAASWRLWFKEEKLYLTNYLSTCV